MVTALLFVVGLFVAGSGSETALAGFDPVRLCQGSEVAGRADLELVHGRYRYRFCDEETREIFRADPERWTGRSADPNEPVLRNHS